MSEQLDKLTDRELDALVAEKVMGFAWFHCVAGTGVERNQFCSKQQEETWRGVGWQLTPISTPKTDSGFVNDSSGCPRYSTSTTDAFTVVEKMRKRGWRFRLDEWDESGEHVVIAQFYTGLGGVGHFDESLPPSRAICLAALAAVAD